jgi:tryptophanyl-tRNA synthetase
MENLDDIDRALEVGATKATTVANDVLSRVRFKLGY